MGRKRLLNISKSKDLLNWKELYKDSVKPFSILSLKSKKENSMSQIAEFSVEIHKNGNKVIIELSSFSNPYNEDIYKVITNSLLNISKQAICKIYLQNHLASTYI